MILLRGAKWVWHELVRPRGPVRHRFYRLKRRSEAGVALLLVMASLLFLTTIVTEIAYAASIRLQLAAHQRDEAKAEALAVSGVNVYRLVLTASKALGRNSMIQQFEASLGIDLGDALWQMVPFMNSGLMRMLFVAGDSADEEEIGEMKTEGLTDEQRTESRESTGFDKNFLDFDGDFYAEVTDEDRKINVSAFRATNRAELQEDPTAVELYGMMSGVRQCPGPYTIMGPVTSASEAEKDDLDRFFLDRNLERWELIADLADWTDMDNVRIYDGGAEETLYNRIEPNPYLPKNAGFDTLEEIRLIEGWHLDDVWEKFGKNLTVYGKGKININTAECDVVWALLKSYIEPQPSDDTVFRLMQAMEEQKALTTFHDAKAFMTFLTSQGVQVDPKLKSALTAESRVFRVTSTGTVNAATVTIEAVIDFTSSSTGKIVYWRVR